MSFPVFNPKELESSGNYPSCTPVPGPPILNSPISTHDHTMRAFNHENPGWYLNCGMTGGDYVPFRPGAYFPDLAVAHNWKCQEPEPDWKAGPQVREGWFGVQQKYVYEVGGCMPVPGTQLISDMNDWKQLPWPSLDAIDWETCAKNNADYLSGPLPIEFCIPTLYWERMMAILEVSEAAVAMIDEDQEDAVKDFFEKLTEFYCDYLERVKKYFNPQLILAHDDWGHQNGPFWSHETCEEMVAPYFKRFVAKVHELDMRFELHCCGKAESLVDILIDAGVDLWIPQTMNDVDGLIRAHRDDPILFGVYAPATPRDMPQEQVEDIALEFYKRFEGMGPIGYVDYFKNPVLYKKLYELSRQELAG